MSVFPSFVCWIEIFCGFMKWGLRNQKAEKWLNNGYFQDVGSLLNARYPIFFILLFEQYGEVLQSAKI